MIEINQKKYHRTGKGLSGYDMAAYLPKLKKQYPFLKNASAGSLQISCYNLADAYSRFFKKQNGYPKFKKKGIKDSFKAIVNCAVDGNRVKLPKASWTKFRGGKLPTGNFKGVTVTRDSTGCYYASLLFDSGGKEIALQQVTNVMGIDVGVKDLATLSTGQKIVNNKFLKQKQGALRKAQKALARKLKGSNKRAQATVRVAKLHKKIANQRKDYNHKISRLIVNSCDNQTAIAVESLNVSGMMKNHKLAKSIADCGWYQLGAFLRYKAADVGKQVIEVGRFYPSSKTCSSCGCINSNLTLSIRSWQCSDCGTIHDRDHNAAINIAKEGARILKTAGRAVGGEEISLQVLLRNITRSSLIEADKSILNN